MYYTYLSVSMHAVIDQFSGLYSIVMACWNLKRFVAKMVLDVLPWVFLTFVSSKSLKLSFTPEIV